MDWFTVFTNSITDVFTRILGWIPGLISILAILIIGWVIAVFLRRVVVTILTKVGLDDALEKTGVTKLIQDVGAKNKPSVLVGSFTYWIIMIAVFISIGNYLNLQIVSRTLNSLLLFVPNIIAAIIIITVAYILGNFLAEVIKAAGERAEITFAELLGNIAKWSILILAGIVALEQLRIETDILKLAFTYLVGAVAVALAIAFGFGGQGIARNVAASRFIKDKYKKGQNIDVEGLSGTIEEIGWNTMVIKTTKGLIEIPNGVFVDKVVRKS